MIVNVLVYSLPLCSFLSYMTSGNNEENYFYDDDDDNDDENKSYQPFRNIEQTLFEVANTERLSILFKLKEENNKNNFNLSKELNIIVQEVHRHTNRLLKTGLVQKDSSTGYFSLTIFGNIVLMQLSALDFISKNRNYFSDHTLGKAKQERMFNMCLIGLHIYIAALIPHSDLWLKTITAVKTGDLKAIILMDVTARVSVHVFLP